MSRKRDPEETDELAHVGPVYARFGGMTWPRAGSDAFDEVAYRLHWGGYTDEDVAIAASVMSAYRALVWKTGARRAYVVRMLRKCEVGAAENDECLLRIARAWLG